MYFTIDDDKPEISLDPQEMDREIQIGKIFRLNVSETNTLSSVLYLWNGNPAYNGVLTHPYEITVPSLPDGEIELIINASNFQFLSAKRYQDVCQRY